MSEYRRFVAYFYEYIDGKKQQNAGFARVELRDGMWSILFRLIIPETPEPPLQVYGFVREREKLQGFLLGTMASGGNAPEEWAWRADTPLALEKYYFGQLNGIRIESGDGRTFFTVWDDEAMNPAEFVLEQLQPEEVPQSEQPEKPLQPEEPSRPEQPEEVPQPEEQPEEVPQPETPEEPPRSEQPEEMPQPETPEEPPQPQHQEEPLRQPQAEIPSPGPVEIPAPQVTEMPSFLMSRGQSAQSQKVPNSAETLLRSRQRFRPFQDGEFTDCVQIKLCDVLPLQQEHWKVGRSNFLQHGYYLYRHLLLGRTKDGGYILGVPGMRNQQEEYMAQTFGYGRFKQSGSNSYGRRFGYWYRILKEPDKIPDGPQ